MMDQTVLQYLGFMSGEKGASDNTIAAYRNDLVQFTAFLSTLNLNGAETDWARIDTEAIKKYVIYLNGRRYAEASVARKVAAVRSFFQFLQAERVIRENPMETIQSPPVAKKDPRTLSVQEVATLLDQPSKRRGPEGLRDRAMIELLYATGVRVTELVSIDIDDISIDPRMPTVRCFGKGAKERTIPIHVQSLRVLVSYLNEGRPKLIKGGRERALFVNRWGKRLTRQGSWLIIKQYAQQAGIQGSVTPHSLRHSFATHMLRGGAPLRNVQELLGHADVSTTRVYAQVTDEHVREVYTRAHPRSELNLVSRRDQ